VCTSSGKLLWLSGGGLLDLGYRDLVDFLPGVVCDVVARVLKCFGHLHEEEGADACT
jgi:hypothetical protein